jgi:Indole-3-glycerol phosphate synthase
LETTQQLAKHVPEHIFLVSESGIFVHEDVGDGCKIWRQGRSCG